MSKDEASQGMSNCYVFKSRLQEYAQKVGLSTPIYETIKDGPSHEPTFRSTVVVNNIRYDSLPGFFNRKAAEQSAAEVALANIAQSGQMKESISQPVHETGLCKNLLQEYAQKMNYAMPLYDCRKDETQGRGSSFSCIIEIGGIKYIGGSARTKKEAEIKAARTALLAIQTSASDANDQLTGSVEFTVLPVKKKPTSSGTSVSQPAALKPKKRRFKKKPRKKKHAADEANNVIGKNRNGLKIKRDMQPREMKQIDSLSMPEADSGTPLPEATNGFTQDRTEVRQFDSLVMPAADSGTPLPEATNGFTQDRTEVRQFDSLVMPAADSGTPLLEAINMYLQARTETRQFDSLSMPVADSGTPLLEAINRHVQSTSEMRHFDSLTTPVADSGTSPLETGNNFQ